MRDLRRSRLNMRDQKSPNLPLDLTVEMKLLNINADTHSKSSVYKITK